MPHCSIQKQQNVSQNKIQNRSQKLALKTKIELFASIFLLLPLLISHVGMSFNIAIINNIINSWVQLTLASLIYWYWGLAYWKGTYYEIFKNKKLGMKTLILTSATVAYFYGIILLILNQYHGNNMIFFEIAGATIVLVNLGETISDHLQKRTLQGVKDLWSLQVKHATKIDINTQTQVEVAHENIGLGDYLLIAKGDKIPTDGIIYQGQTSVDESMMTGESQLVSKTVNSAVIGGTINVNNPIIIQATKVGQDTILANILKAVKNVQAQKPKVQRIVDTVSGIFTPLIILLALLTLTVHYFLGSSLSTALTYAITTLVIACPCALGITTPLALSVGVNKAIKENIYYRKVDAFEKINQIKAICFDKTGTITTGKLTIKTILGNQDYWPLATQLESFSNHPIASAFKTSRHFSSLNSSSSNSDLVVQNVEEITGVGLKAIYQGQNVMMSSLNYAIENHFKIKQTLLDQVTQHHNDLNVVAFSIDNEVMTLFILEDELRDNSQATIKKFLKLGLEVYMISGDKSANVEKIAQKVGIKHYYSNVKPTEKAQIIQRLQNQGKQVAFVGDGINDIVALEQADLGIAIGSGSEMAINASSLILLNSNLHDVYRAIILTKKTKNNIYANLAWAFAYNLFAIPLAMLGFVNPTIALLAMISSQMLVIFNSLIFKARKYRKN